MAVSEVFIDSSGFFALWDAADRHFEQAGYRVLLKAC